MASIERLGGKVYSEPRPIAGAEAFTDLQDADHVQPQAATLLCIGYHIRGDGIATKARVLAASQPGQLPIGGRWEGIPADDVQRLGFPTMQAGAVRFRPKELQRALAVSFAAQPRLELPGTEKPRPDACPTPQVFL
jgi:hypothetical protein